MARAGRERAPLDGVIEGVCHQTLDEGGREGGYMTALLKAL